MTVYEKQLKPCLAVKYSQLEGIIDPKRYFAKISDTVMLRVSDVCDVLDNKIKIVMVCLLKRTTIASLEFLALRCKKGYNLEAVMAVLKTKYYCNLM